MKLGTETGSLVNHLLSGGTTVPVVGLGATILHWTDRTAVTIIEVSPRATAVVVQHDKVTRTDSNGMSDAQDYSYESDPDGATETFTLRKNGRWVRQGDSMKGQQLRIGTRLQYHDYSF